MNHITSSTDSVALVAFIAVVIVIVSLLIRLYNKLKPYPVDPTLPGPERHFFIGQLKFMIDNEGDMPRAALKESEKHQWRTWGGPIPHLGVLRGAHFFLTDPKNLEHILRTNFENYEKGDLVATAFRELLGVGIFNSDGAHWYRHRKITSKMFSTNLLREASRVTLEKVQELSMVLKQAETKGSTIDIQDMFFRLTFDITSVVSFGVEYGSIQNETQHPFALAFDEMQERIVQRVPDPLFVFKRALHLGLREQRIRELKHIIDDNANEIIRSRRRTAECGTALGPDILSRFIDYANSNNDPISDEELRDVVMNFLVAGRDTTACALSWALFELSRHPEVVQKLIQEAEEICGKADGEEEGDYSYDTVGKLEYTHAVILEALRLHPSVPIDHKYAIKDDVLPDGTFIPKQSMITYTIYALGRSPQVWGSDALEFKPERFLGEKEPSAFKYPVFNAGKRLCLGKPMAMNILKFTLAYILPRFEFRDTAGHSGEYNWSIVQKLNGGFPVEVSLRK